ncbi:MAG: glycosyltransferase family 2 protein [Pseudomonadota bacterium]
MAAPPDETNPAISVIIVNYNAGDRLARCLGAVAAQTYPASEVIVIDNGSEDSSLQAADEAAIPITVIKAGENLGFAAANNRAAKQASGDWLALLNPDAYPQPDWLREIASAINKRPGYDAFGSLQIDAHDTDVIDGAGDVFHASGVPFRNYFGQPVKTAPPTAECFAPCAAAAVYRRETFEALGGFAESFFCYCEDLDLGYRLRLKGGRALQLNEARVLHEGSGITGRASDFAIYHGHRNRIWAYARNSPAMVLLLTFPYVLIVALGLFGMFLVSGKGQPYARAMADALKGLPKQMKVRKDIQSQRSVNTLDILRRLAWSPISLLQRRHK